MGNKKAADLGIGAFMNEVKNNKSAAKEEPTEGFDKVAGNSEDRVEKEESVIRNVILSPEALFRLESVKKTMNEGRRKGEKPISLGRLMADIITEFLDDKYPQTKKMYKLMNELKYK